MLWLNKQGYNTCLVKGMTDKDATLSIAKDELTKYYKGKEVSIRVDPLLNLGEGYMLTDSSIIASSSIGILYGAYDYYAYKRLAISLIFPRQKNLP